MGDGAHLASKHMPKVATALSARDLCALTAEGVVHVAIHRTRDLIVKCRPADKRLVVSDIHPP